MMVLVLACLVMPAALATALWRAYGSERGARAKLERVRERERLLLDAVRALLDASRRSSDDVIAAVAQAVRRAEPAIDAVLTFIPAGEELLCIYADGARVDHYARVALRRDDPRALPAQAARVGHRASGPAGMLVPTDRRAIAVPMNDAAGLRAVVYASSRDDVAIDEDAIVRSVEHAAAPYALALEREHDRADATYDGLTGLLTPRAFRERLRGELERSRFGPPSISTLWFIDTDRFKSVNDEHGHAAGDAVLQAMADLLRAHLVPDRDIAARNGGDEFCALVHDPQKSAAIERAHAFCSAVRTFDFGIPLTISASVGVASFPFDARDASELLEVADAAMYHSKRNGRDRVSFAVNGTTFAVFREPHPDPARAAVY